MIPELVCPELIAKPDLRPAPLTSLVLLRCLLNLHSLSSLCGLSSLDCTALKAGLDIAALLGCEHVFVTNVQGKAYIQVVHISAGEWPVDQLLGTSLNAVVDEFNGLQRSSVHNLSRSRQQMEVVVPQPQELVQPERSEAWPRRGWQRCTCTAFCRLGRCSSGSLEYIEFEGRFGSLADVLCRSLLKIALILMILLSTAI